MLLKYKYPFLILVLGLVLALWPAREKKTAAAQPTPTEEQAEQTPDWQRYREQTEAQLASILSGVEGAGRVRVMLTLRSGPAVRYQTDAKTETITDGEKNSSASEYKTVILSRGGSYNEAAVVKTDYPVFQGALILCEGGDNAAVRLALSTAVAALLGLGTDQITVVKMK